MSDSSDLFSRPGWKAGASSDQSYVGAPTKKKRKKRPGTKLSLMPDEVLGGKEYFMDREVGQRIGNKRISGRGGVSWRGGFSPERAQARADAKWSRMSDRERNEQYYLANGYDRGSAELAAREQYRQDRAAALGVSPSSSGNRRIGAPLSAVRSPVGVSSPDTARKRAVMARGGATGPSTADRATQRLNAAYQKIGAKNRAGFSAEQSEAYRLKALETGIGSAKAPEKEIVTAKAMADDGAQKRFINGKWEWKRSSEA